MPSIINNGLSGLRSHQTALATTAHNISNTNSEGYSRQVTEFGSSPPVRFGDMSVGTGVTISGITRVMDGFVIEQVRENTIAYSQVEMYHSNASAIDSLIADQSPGVIPTVEQFFSSLQDASTDPASLPLRQVVLSESEVMVGRFNVLYEQLDEINTLTNQQVTSLVGDINVLATSISDINRAISENSGGTPGSQPNDLLDQRDQAIKELSTLVGVDVITQNDGSVSITIGTGQPLVVGTTVRELGVQTGDMDASKLDVILLDSSGESGSVISKQLSGGQLGGLLEFREEILQPSFRELGRVALAVAETVNEEHRRGMDFEGDVNNDFFVDINDRVATTRRVAPSSENAPPANQELSVTIEDIGQLTTDDYKLTFGPQNNIYNITREGSRDVVASGSVGNTFPVSIEVEGIAIHLEGGTFQAGDQFLIQPTRYGATELELQVSATQDLAFALPVLAQSTSSNSGTGVITPGEVLDITAPAFSVPGELNPPLVIKFTSATSYDVLDNSDPSNPIQLNPAMRNQVFTPGFENKIFTDSAGETSVSSTGADIGLATAGATNGYSAETFNFTYRDPETLVVTNLPSYTTSANDSAADIAAQLNTNFNGIEASAYTQATVAGAGFTATSVDINGVSINTPTLTALVTGINNDASLQAQGISAELVGSDVLIRDPSGQDLQFTPAVGNATIQGAVVAAGNTVSVGGEIEIIMGEGYTLDTSGNGVFTTNPPAQSTYTGYQVVINGKPQPGDTFSIDFNKEGLSDNRNLLKIIGLQSIGIVEDGKLNYADAYGQLVESVGAQTKEAGIASETQKSLLSQAEQRRESISGVNLDEEASNLVKFEVAYNAAAQVIAIARSLFDTLIATFR
jgi:flagellar hook-associated protein 1 FlgK